MKDKNSKFSKKRKIWILRNKVRLTYLSIITIVIMISVSTLLLYFFLPFTSFEEEKRFLYIPTNQENRLSSFQTQIDTSSLFISNDIVKAVLFITKSDKYMFSGKYEIEKNISLFKLVTKLKKGLQTPHKFTLNKIRTKEQFASYIGKEFEFDSLSIINKLNDTVICQSLGYDTNTIMTMFIQNTYYIYWNTSIDNFLKRMKIEYTKFWTSNQRTFKMSKFKLSPQEVTILASIIDEETTNNNEKPIMASVYLNRLKQKRRLEADPTVKFASGNFSLTRITFRTIKQFSKSLYNTYKHYGLPPGPICIPSIPSIDAVLDAPETKYLYFCAKPNGKNEHVFANTYAQHLKNARLYHQYLRERRRTKKKNIKK